MTQTIDCTIFKSPFTCMIAGPTQSGKTTLLINILNSATELIEPAPNRIMYCYSRDQPSFDKLKHLSIEFHHGLPDLDEFHVNTNNLIILDDLMDQCEKDKSIQSLFTVDSHHKNISTFLISQNLYSRGRYARTISLNCNYMIIFNNPRDRSQIHCLARQMYPTISQFLIEAYEDATESQQHGYLFIDLTQATNSKYRVQTSILCGETRIIYQPINTSKLK